MDKNERIKTIINNLRLKGAVSIKDLKKRLDVSDMTIRRDLSILEKDNIVELIPGGAIFKAFDDIEMEKYIITHEETVRIREKIRIGQRASTLIEPNDTIILDVGSTVEYVTKFIPENIPVTVLCYALNILAEVYRKKNCNPIFAGGYFHPNTLMFECSEGINLINRTRADKAFVSAAGISDKLGVTCANPYEIETKKAIMGSAKTKILVADSSKFGKVKIAYFTELKDFDKLITDTELPEDFQSILRELDIDVTMV
jgi:DeoR family deoxyribose operon repressor